MHLLVEILISLGTSRYETAIRQAAGPSADLSTGVALKADLHAPIGVHDDGHGIAVVQRLIQGVLTLVHPALFVLNSLATPRVAQSIGGWSNRQGVHYGDVGHESPPGVELLQFYNVAAGLSSWPGLTSRR